MKVQLSTNTNYVTRNKSQRSFGSLNVQVQRDAERFVGEKGVGWARQLKKEIYKSQSSTEANWIMWPDKLERVFDAIITVGISEMVHRLLAHMDARVHVKKVVSLVEQLRKARGITS